MVVNSRFDTSGRLVETRLARKLLSLGPYFRSPMTEFSGHDSTASNKQVAGVGLIAAFAALGGAYAIAAVDSLSRISFLWSIHTDVLSWERDLGPTHSTEAAVAALIGCQLAWMVLYLTRARRATDSRLGARSDHFGRSGECHDVVDDRT